jgi:hypothetical protein
MPLAEEDAIAAIRVLIPDDAPVFGDNSDEYLFTDNQISQVWNTVGNQSALRAAGMLMIAVGNSEAMIGKVIKNVDQETDGSKLSAQWRAGGEFYINLANKEDGEIANQFFQIVPNYGTRDIAGNVVDWELGNFGPYYRGNLGDQTW